MLALLSFACKRKEEKDSLKITKKIKIKQKVLLQLKTYCYTM